MQAGQWQAGDPEILIVMDSGYDVAYLSHALTDLPVVLVGRLRSDRVMCAGFRNEHPARGQRPPAAFLEFRGQFVKEPVDAVLLDLRESDGVKCLERRCSDAPSVHRSSLFVVPRQCAAKAAVLCPAAGTTKSGDR
ncbi:MULTISPECIES: transposase [Streptomyces]|uniref:transposase n=1 Tax=Streptomyces TaxID=1883 RepID=UPI0026903245